MGMPFMMMEPHENDVHDFVDDVDSRDEDHDRCDDHEQREVSGNTDWKKLDAFCVASTQVLGHTYCGSHKLWQQLCNFNGLQQIAQNIIGLRVGATIDFKRLLDAIGKVGVPGYANGGYWTVHLARIFVPDFGGMDVFKDITYGPEALKSLYNMGTGASSMRFLGVTEVNLSESIPALIRCIKTLSTKYAKRPLVFTPAHLACAACECERRNGFGQGAIQHRPGL